MNKIIVDNYRRFGTEIELNTTTDVLKPKEEVPDGAPLVARLIRQVTNSKVELHGWHHTNNNNCWIIKPDGSCGMEICTPILKGAYDLTKLVRVVDVLSGEPTIKSDRRCSFHVHINLDDLKVSQIGSILAWWIKCEPVFFDFLPTYRRCSRHTQLIGMSDLFEHNRVYGPEDIIDRLSTVKYFSINTYHMRQKRRKSLEVRVADHTACLDPMFVKNWIRLILRFVEVSKTMPKKTSTYSSYKSALAWLDPIEVFAHLGFDQTNLSDGMKQCRDWFLLKLSENAPLMTTGIWQPGTRDKALYEIKQMVRKYQPNFSEDQETLLYSPKYML